MSFYITLPSNASMNYHPDNVQSNFTINLPDRLLLDNNYKVGLAEISYTQTDMCSIQKFQLHYYNQNSHLYTKYINL